MYQTHFSSKYFHMEKNELCAYMQFILQQNTCNIFKNREDQKRLLPQALSAKALFIFYFQLQTVARNPLDNNVLMMFDRSVTLGHS